MSNLNDIFEEEDELIVQLPKSKHKNLRDPDLSEIDLPDELKQAALYNYRKYGVSTHKGNNRNKILYGCFMIACMQQNYPIAPPRLMKKLGFDMNKKHNLSNVVQSIQEKIGSRYHVYTPLYMVEAYLIEMYQDIALLPQISKIWEKISDNPQVKLFDIKIVAIWLLLKLKLETEAFLSEYYGVSLQKYRKVGVILTQIYDGHSS